MIERAEERATNDNGVHLWTPLLLLDLQ